MSIAQNLNNIKSSLPPHVTLVAVSKTKPVSDLMEAYQTGQRIFGENKIQEMTEKWEQMPKDIQWHMIGHVQTNKVKYMAPFVSLIHGVDSLKLLQEINKQAQKNNRVIDCLLQIYIAEEESKFGLDENELEEILQFIQKDNSLQNIKIVGLMGMATFTENKNQIKKEFLHLKSIFDKYKPIETSNLKFQMLSMGMSSDYQLAVDCGSTMVRIGSSIFGSR
ncbi:YggS family pyridoxal phosphate-dependent enzyme [Flavobacterium columnare]|uniref:YggS family pyridoxal phosphate-dependent enzyme n=1 Tax=Flavobacterium columnare TaxID=996 RepID=UPI0017812FE7|nr:YggS family pyridoxal phosphate-dependent enzyme [Flavobacterium columnare]QOG90311.1 YggS family pyridoxal phosphate-dependent enzyme [Flavobacterium columnare]QOG92967.1 YggS family pyridoxal phosphate-dependent enzyme [Flavobacterium columnare]QOG95632.1 YggS family pyridoxal phosphate-dependent enzyme [Flavobacterium columnare]QOG98292.1 YggS family pyridoxal phosphate-dependent enzyme [Flavobacterium columnare]QOH00951.1 YggS family pyridoxal phosphate-dependent enzyme [Flavobacterium 